MKISAPNLLSQTARARELKFQQQNISPSPTFHMSCEASCWRVCYQPGLPRLVIGAMETYPVDMFVALVVLHILLLPNRHLHLLLSMLLLKSGSHHTGLFRINGSTLG